MSCTKTCPPAAGRRRGGENWRHSYPKSTPRQGDNQGSPTVFPLCELHGVRLVHGLPPRCPLAAESWAGAIVAVKDRAFALMDAGESAVGMAALEAAGICERCQASRTPWGRRLVALAKANRGAQDSGGAPLPPAPRFLAPAPANEPRVISRRVPARGWRR